MNHAVSQRFAIPDAPCLFVFQIRDSERRRFLTACLSTLICSFIAHGFIFSNEFFSHDSIDFFTLGIAFYTEVGRFFIRLYEYCRGGISVPWLIGILYIFWMSLAGYLLSCLLNLKSGYSVALACCLFCVNISMTLTAATYIYCLDAYALSLCAAVLSAYLFLNPKNNIFLSLTGILPLILSLGIYQPYFTVAASLCLIELFRRTAIGNRALDIIFSGVRCLILLAVSFGCYYLLWMRVCKIIHVTPQRLDESLFSARDNGGFLSRLPDLIRETNADYFDFLCNKTSSQGALLSVIHILLFIFIIIRLIRLLCRADLPIFHKILLPVLMALMPTAFHSAYLLFSGGFNDLTAFAGELLYLIPLLDFNPNLNPENPVAAGSGAITDKPPDANPSAHGGNASAGQIPGQSPASIPNHKPSPARVCSRAARALAIILLSLVIWQHIIFANQAYMKKALEKNATLILAGRILDQIESVEGYNPGVTPVAFAGMLSYNWKVNVAEGEFLEIQDWTGLYNSYSATYNLGGYITRYLHYPIPLDRSRNYAELPEVRDMPMYPAPGSVQLIDGTVVVKLSE